DGIRDFHVTGVQTCALPICNLAWACRRAAGAGVTVLIEPLNPRDMPGYLLRTQADAHAIVAEVGEPNLMVQMDLYHCQIVEGDEIGRASCRERWQARGVGGS